MEARKIELGTQARFKQKSNAWGRLEVRSGRGKGAGGILYSSKVGAVRSTTGKRYLEGTHKQPAPQHGGFRRFPSLEQQPTGAAWRAVRTGGDGTTSASPMSPGLVLVLQDGDGNDLRGAGSRTLQRARTR